MILNLSPVYSFPLARLLAKHTNTHMNTYNGILNSTNNKE